MMCARPAANRPRVEGAREGEILDATIEMLLEVGYDRLTMDAVAKRAKASKATLYRRWEAKANLVLDALLRAKQSPRMPCPDTGTLRGDLLEMFCGPRSVAARTGTGVLGAVVTALTNDPAFAEMFREQFVAPKVAVSVELYRRAQERGEIREDIDIDVIGPALAGILLHRAFVLGLPFDDDIVERVVDNIILPAVRRPEPAGEPARSQKKTSAQKARKP